MCATPPVYFFISFFASYWNRFVASLSFFRVRWANVDRLLSRHLSPQWAERSIYMCVYLCERMHGEKTNQNRRYTCTILWTQTIESSIFVASPLLPPYPNVCHHTVRTTSFFTFRMHIVRWMSDERKMLRVSFRLMDYTAHTHQHTRTLSHVHHMHSQTTNIVDRKHEQHIQELCMNGCTHTCTSLHKYMATVHTNTCHARTSFVCSLLLRVCWVAIEKKLLCRVETNSIFISCLRYFVCGGLLHAGAVQKIERKKKSIN